MKEKNKNSLDQAIGALKNYEVPPRLWDGLEWKLDREQSQKKLRESIDDLPNYEAPSAIWEAIENQLDEAITEKPIAKRRSMPIWRMLAAAALVGVTLFGLQWMMLKEKESIQYSYTEETIDERLFVADWVQDDAAFKMMMEFCKEQQIDTDPAFKNLMNELTELNEARETLMMAMEQYGKDAEIIEQITTVEHERSDVVKQMMDKI